jgi:hypothetical protein
MSLQNDKLTAKELEDKKKKKIASINGATTKKVANEDVWGKSKYDAYMKPISGFDTTQEQQKPKTKAELYKLPPSMLSEEEATKIAKGQVFASEPKDETLNSLKTFANNFIDSNEIYKVKDNLLGVDYGEPISIKKNLDTENELLKDQTVLQSIKDNAKESYKSLYPGKEIDQYVVDGLVDDVIKTRIKKNNDEKVAEKKKYQDQQKANGNYTAALNIGINQHISEIDPEEKTIAKNIKEARSFQDLLKSDKATDTQKIDAQSKLNKLAPELQSQLKKYDENLTFQFDNVTGRRLGKKEVEARKKAGETSSMTDQQKEYQKIVAKQKDQDLESLERGYFTHINEYNNLQAKLNRTLNINPNDITTRGLLAAKGYKPNPKTNAFENVKIKDLAGLAGNEYAAKDIQAGLVKPNDGKAYIQPNIKAMLEDVEKDRKRLNLEREAYKTTYLMNIDPKGLKPTLYGSFAEKALEGTIGEGLTEKIGTTKRKELDEIHKVFNEWGIKPSKEQTKAFERSIPMKVAEGVGAFVPELAKFAAINAIGGGILEGVGYAGRLAELGRSENIMDKTLHFGINALKEEGVFKIATGGESQNGGGAGFYAGGQLMNKVMPFRFAGAMARFNPILEKAVLAGPGMIAGSEGAALTEALVKDLSGNKSFKSSMHEMYGKDSDFADRMIVNGFVGSIIGGTHLKGNDFKSISEKRKMFDQTYDELEVLQAENNPANKKKIVQKQNLLGLLDHELQVADRRFNEQNIGDIKSQMDEATTQLQNNNLTEGQRAEAEKVIAKGEASIVATKRSIERNFKAATATGALGKDVKLNIIEGPESADGTIKMSNPENKAEFNPDTNTINVNIYKYKKGVLAQEMGHAMMKVAFKNNPEIAEKFKDAIKSKVESAFAGKKFNGKTFEEAINEAYGENKPAEEYVMNVAEFLQNPKYKEVLLSNKFLPTLKRIVVDQASKIGLDLSSSNPLEVGEKNLNRASDLLEFLYDIGKTAEGNSSSALKKKFEKFKNIVIDGDKLINIETNKEISTEENELKNIENSASKNISENEKKDIFSKATRAYEEAIKSGGSAEVAGLMVGMEMEPLVKRQVEGYLTSKGINMSRDVIEDIVRSVTTDSGPGTFGVPNLVEAWSKGQRLMDYIKAERPSREMINSKAKELGIQDRTAAGSDVGTIDKYIKMAEGGTEQAQLTSYVFGNLPKRILQTLQKSEFADVFNTFSVEDVKNIDKLEESAGISGESSSSSEGYIDTSSPEQYTRVSQKRAETIIGLKPDVIEKINVDANKFLNAQKLENLDAKSIGTVELKDGGKAKVAMLESDKARIIYPDGKVETIKARSPKIVEQYLGAPDKSFQKQFNFKEGLAEDFKNSLYNDLSKHAGNLINNVKATPQYESFIDNTFPLFKDYISQSAVNKRFAEFKEPFMDKVTGKQAREKTAAGNPIFTKKNITLAEWRKYFLADGTQRIDGKRRSLLEALAVELGFDATMNVLGKEAMRKQIESRQADLSVELVDNYVAVVAKQIDRNNPTAMASKIIEEVSKKANISKEEARLRLINVVYDNKGEIRNKEEIIKDDAGAIFYDYVEYNAELDVAKYTQSRLLAAKENSNLKQKLEDAGVTFKYENVNDLLQINKKSEKDLKEYEENFVKPFVASLPAEVSKFTTAANSSLENSVLAPLLGYTSRKNVAGETFSRNRFEDIIKEAKTDIKLSDGLTKEWNDLIKQSKANNKEGAGITINAKAKEHFKSIGDISRSDLSPNEKRKEIDNLTTRDEAIADLNNKEKILELTLKTIKEKAQAIDPTEAGDAEREKLAKNVATMLLNNDGLGTRKYSYETYHDLSMPAEAEIKNEHLKNKAKFGADLIELIVKNELTDEAITKLVKSFQSALGNKAGQLFADVVLGKTADNAKVYKLALSQFKNLGIKATYKESLENVYNWTTKKTAWEELVESNIGKELELDKEDSSVMASKDLGEEISKMIERKTGISSTEELSDAKAQILGKKKGNYKFFVPPNAEDFAGMLYKLYGKGKQGDADMALLKEKLLDPFEKGENAISHYRQKLANDLKAMDASLNELGGEVSKESKKALEKSGFDADQATRVYIWNKQGVEIPGITKEEIKELTDIVSNDNRLRNYAKGVMNLVDFPEPTDSWYGSNLKYDLYTYSTEGVRKDFLTEWNENMKEAFTPENYNRMEAAYGKDFVDNFKQLTKRMRTGKADYENINKVAQKGLDWINGSVGVIMWMNIRSAVLQTTAAFNYINWSDNNVLAAGKTLTNPAEFGRTFKELINSDFLKQRRDGMEINIEDAEIAKAIEKGGNAPQRLFGKLIKAGFKPTQIADSFAIAVGGTPFYLNRTKTYQNEMTIDANGNEVRKYSDAQAKEKAFEDFRSISEENQQSSRQDRVGNVQLGVLGRLIFAFNNTSMQMARLQKKAALDIINKRGDLKTHISKLVYYGVVQNAMFYALQQGMFGMMFGKDDDELKKGESEAIKKKNQEKVVDLANGMIDGILTGSGMTGKLLVTAKNTLLKFQEEAAKENKADYYNVLNEALSVSPPLSSKTKKISTAFKEIKYLGTKKGQKEVEGTGLLNSPYNMPRAKIFSAATNIPLDRLLTKIDNVSTAVAGENVEDWQRIALGFGWDKWSLGMYDKPYLTPEEQKAEDSRIAKEASATAKISREAKKAKEKAIYDALPQTKKDSIDNAKADIKNKKAEQRFIEEQLKKARMSPAELALEKYRKSQERKLKKSSPEYKEQQLRRSRIKDSINNVIKFK